MEQVISFTKTKLEHGWLGNMSPFPIVFNGVEWRTSEALFQSLRFKDKDIQEAIRAEKSPMSAKFVMKANKVSITTEPHSVKDVRNMKMCLKLKLEAHPELKTLLLETGELVIIEDVTKRGDVGGNLFWGAMLVENENGFHWVGKNTLGRLWMEIRTELKNKNND